MKRLFLSGTVLLLVVSLAVMGFSSVGPLPRAAAAGPSFFDCADVTQIPVAECEGLVAIYNATNGPQWTLNDGWLETNTPCSWVGVICSGSAHVTTLFLGGNELTGEIPPEIGNFPYLEDLSLQNNHLSGGIPAEMGNLASLEILNLFINQLEGPLPATLGSLSNLEVFVGFNNQLSGNIPPELGNLSNLDRLVLDNNQLSGSLPPDLGNLATLGSLSLHNNPLSGPLPLSFTGLDSLHFLTFYDTDLCEPPDQAFQLWLDGVVYVSSTGVICEPASDKLNLPFVAR